MEGDNKEEEAGGSEERTANRAFCFIAKNQIQKEGDGGGKLITVKRESRSKRVRKEGVKRKRKRKRGGKDM